MHHAKHALCALLAATATAWAQDIVIVGTTRYDLQSNGSYGKFIAVSADSVAHGVFTGGINNGAGRRVQAWCVDAGLIPIWPVDLFDSRGGYSTMAVTGSAPSNGLPPVSTVAALHTVNGPAVGVDSNGCSMTFDLLSGPDNAVPLWPHLAVDYEDRIHMVCTTATMSPSPTNVYYTASTNFAGWDQPYVVFDSHCRTVSAIATAAKDGPGAALFFLPDAGCAPEGFRDVCCYETRSAHNNLFARIEQGAPVNLSRYQCPESTTPFRWGVTAWYDVDAVFGAGDTAALYAAWPTPVLMSDTLRFEDLESHVQVMEARPALDVWHSAIWCRNLSSVISSWGHVTGWLTADGEEDLPDDSTHIGFCRCANDRVQLAVDPANGWLYALWNSYSLADLRDPSANTAAAQGKKMANGEIYAACSADNGLTWGPRVNLSNTPSPGCLTGQCQSETFASMAETVSNGFLHITYLLDTHAGCSIHNDKPDDGSDETLNNCYYLRVPVSAVPPHAGTPWDAAGHIGLGSYRRAWHLDAGHPDTTRLIDQVAIFNEGRAERRLVSLVMYHDALDVFGDADSPLFATWEVLRGDPTEPLGWIANPAGSNDWDGRLPAQRATVTRVSVGHRGLPLREQAFRLTFDDGTQRVYRYIYQSENGMGSRVLPIDIHDLDSYAADTLYHNDGVESVPRERPEAFTLLAAAPNPFNPATEISFSLAAPAETRLTVFNLRGETVARLVDGALPAGAHRVRFDGAGLASGVYLAALEVGGRRGAIKLLLAK